MKGCSASLSSELPALSRSSGCRRRMVEARRPNGWVGGTPQREEWPACMCSKRRSQRFATGSTSERVRRISLV